MQDPLLVLAECLHDKRRQVSVRRRSNRDDGPGDAGHPCPFLQFRGGEPRLGRDSCLIEDCVFRLLMAESSIANGGGDVLGSM